MEFVAEVSGFKGRDPLWGSFYCENHTGAVRVACAVWGVGVVSVWRVGGKVEGMGQVIGNWFVESFGECGWRPVGSRILGVKWQEAVTILSEMQRGPRLRVVRISKNKG